jgi:hypothetical protein
MNNNIIIDVIDTDDWAIRNESLYQIRGEHFRRIAGHQGKVTKLGNWIEMSNPAFTEMYTARPAVARAWIEDAGGVWQQVGAKAPKPPVETNAAKLVAHEYIWDGMLNGGEIVLCLEGSQCCKMRDGNLTCRRVSLPTEVAV